MLNREVFYEDPTKRDLPNQGVARVKQPGSKQEWDVLDFELSHFVCEGGYAAGLERILSSFLGHLGQPKQPAVWVSGFYGSGKSHFLRVLEHLWADTCLPSGATAQSIATVSPDVTTHLKELAIAGTRGGGLWAAAGTLGAGAKTSVRLAFLGVLFAAASLPSQYSPARFVIWLRQSGIYDEVVAKVEAAGKSMAKELANLLVATTLPEALLAVRPDLGEDVPALRMLLAEQYPNKTDIDESEFIDTVRQVLELQSKAPGRVPLTLIVLDEMQQYLADDQEKALTVDAIAQAIASEFASQVLLAAAGQQAMGATPTLQKLQARFPVRVELEDTDVETVTREVIL